MPPEIDISLTAADLEYLEQVRISQGLESIEQAAEWLAKTAVRKAARRTTGRGRALYPVEGNQ
ncbi:MAG: hypothetical protein WDA10_08870 [Porticoccaceae bacterium]|jgi:hypothetical protein